MDELESILEDIRNDSPPTEESSSDPISKEVSFPDEHVGQVEVFALDREDNRVTGWKLYDAFPRLMNILPMGQSAEGIVRVNCTFAFRRWSSRAVDSRDSEKLFGLLNFRKNSFKNAIKSKSSNNSGPGI